LVSYDSGQGPTPVIENTNVTAGFLADYEIVGIGGCNTYSSQYLLDGSSLQITSLTSGRKNCPQPAGLMAQEEAYFTLLSTVAIYQIAGTQLILGDSAGNAILAYEQIVATPF
jgi:heat shock protein HslJ